MVRILLVALLVGVAASANAQTTTDPADLVKQARALTNEGKHDEAAALYRRVLKTSPQSVDALMGLGVVLDLQGKYSEARVHLTDAIDHATPGPVRNQALNAMAISYVFEGKAADAVKYLMPVHRQQLIASDFGGAAATANAIGRIYLELGDMANAKQWYERGYEHSKQIADLPTPDRDLWELRWLHAQARMAAREGKADDARKHVAAFEQVMNRRGKLADDNEIYRYLVGYVAYYTKDYARAVDELSKGNLNDPFIVYLLAMAYEGRNDTSAAQQHYRRALEINAHTLNTAFVRPHAQAKLKPAQRGSPQLR